PVAVAPTPVVPVAIAPVAGSRALAASGTAMTSSRNHHSAASGVRQRSQSPVVSLNRAAGNRPRTGVDRAEAPGGRPAAGSGPDTDWPHDHLSLMRNASRWGTGESLPGRAYGSRGDSIEPAQPPRSRTAATRT